MSRFLTKKICFSGGGHKLHNEFQLTDLCESENSFFSCFSELETIGKKYGTDKCSMAHNYLNKYEIFLKKFHDKRVRVLELGVKRTRDENSATKNVKVPKWGILSPSTK